jgi:hypothetical protein
MSKSSVLRYRSPVSGHITTINLPLFSGLPATFRTAQAADPLDIHTTKPSSEDKGPYSGNSDMFLLLSKFISALPLPFRPLLLIGPDAIIIKT